MLFYEQPELLNHEMHGSLGLRRLDRPFAFAKRARAVPLTLGEIPSAQKAFPVIFSDLENPVPLAVVGLDDDINLFVDDNGAWERGIYIPAYVRRYPFALATRADDQYAVVIDRAADSVSENPDRPFFDDGNITPETQAIIDFCGSYDAEARQTARFGLRLRELGLLTGQRVSRSTSSGEDAPIAAYVAVDERKLGSLGDAVLNELLDKGYLAALFAHLFSLDNWQALIERHVQTGTSEIR